ncbi:MAG: hypothetical protein LBQ78_07515 [Tannerellaceae bacterium]|jgi:hypothetical protein|nr:hypothetical protein [Tannerellaceae bacterium]
MAYNLLIVFLLVFSFPVPLFGNSIALSILLSAGMLLKNGQLREAGKLAFSPYAFAVWTGTLLLAYYAFFYSFVRGTFDFARVRILFSMLLGCVACILAYTSLKGKRDDTDYMPRLIVYVFVIQSIIEMAAFVSPACAGIVKRFQFESDMALAEEAYSGFRGLAISGRLYFEFAVTYGVVIILQMKRMVDAGRVSFLHSGELLLLVIGGFFAGRTVFAGLLFALLLLLLARVSVRMKMAFIVRTAIGIGALAALCVILLPGEITGFIQTILLPWVFDLFIKYQETGTATTSFSFNTLNEMYRVEITPTEWLIGSGHYYNPDGTYYKHVDAGYLRHILYWGLLGSALNFLYACRFFYRPFKRLSKGAYNDRLFLAILFAYTLMVHYKGDILGASRFYYIVVILYLFHFIHIKKPIKQTA